MKKANLYKIADTAISFVEISSESKSGEKDDYDDDDEEVKPREYKKPTKKQKMN